MWLGGHWIFILQFNICHVLTASAKHNEHDGANNSDGQETADSHNGDHIGRQRCSLILASSSFRFYTNNKTSCQKLLNISLWLQKLRFWYQNSVSLVVMTTAERHKERKFNSCIPMTFTNSRREITFDWLIDWLIDACFWFFIPRYLAEC